MDVKSQRRHFHCRNLNPRLPVFIQYSVFLRKTEYWINTSVDLSTTGKCQLKRCLVLYWSWSLGELPLTLFVARKEHCCLEIREPRVWIPATRMSSLTFDVHMSVRSKYIFKVQPTRCKFSRAIYFYKLLYMFQAVSPPIIRSTKL